MKNFVSSVTARVISITLAYACLVFLNQTFTAHARLNNVSANLVSIWNEICLVESMCVFKTSGHISIVIAYVLHRLMQAWNVLCSCCISCRHIGYIEITNYTDHLDNMRIWNVIERFHLIRELSQLWNSQQTNIDTFVLFGDWQLCKI